MTKQAILYYPVIVSILVINLRTAVVVSQFVQTTLLGEMPMMMEMCKN